MYTLRKVVEVDAAHYLPAHPGKCKQLHGHRWRFLVEINSNELNADGMVLDFGEIKQIIGQLDHQCINEMPWFEILPPTAENLAKWVHDEICELLASKPNNFTATVAVTVEETPGSSVTYRQ
jgi:6-pyruvoyltetrahydropterin/6-carboxytetrahydropterin synthase